MILIKLFHLYYSNLKNYQLRTKNGQFLHKSTVKKTNYDICIYLMVYVMIKRRNKLPKGRKVVPIYFRSADTDK